MSSKKGDGMHGRDNRRTMRALRGGIGLAAVAVALVLPRPALATPTATTQPATNITATDAALNGTFNNGGEQVTWHFDYATAAEFSPSGTYPHATRPQADTFLILPWVVPLDEG